MAGQDLSPKYGDFSLEPLNTPQRRRVESTLLVDLRRHPRFDTRIAARARGAEDAAVDVLVTNISQTGLRLEGDREMIRTLLPGLEQLDRHVPASLKVAFVLAAEGTRPVRVKLACRSVYARCERDGVFQIGMMITAFDTGRDAYAEYIRARQAATRAGR